MNCNKKSDNFVNCRGKRYSRSGRRCFAAFVIAGFLVLTGCNGSSPTIFTTDGACNDLVEVAANGAAGLTLSATSLAFELQTVGTTSFRRQIVVTNNSAASQRIERALANCDQFVVETTAAMPLQLRPGQSVGFTLAFEPASAVAFDPAAPPAVSGQFLLYAEGSILPLGVLLTGTGVNEDNIVNVAPQSIEFGAVPVGQTSSRVPVLVWNGGTTVTDVASVSTVAPFSVTGFGQKLTLAAAEVLPLEVTFAPTAPGDFEQTLVIEISRPGFTAFLGIPLHGAATPAEGDTEKLLHFSGDLLY